jgi:hypothetical protein
MDFPPQSSSDTQNKDAEQLKLLAVFHFILVLFCFLGIGFLFLHYSLMHRMFDDPNMWKGQKNPPPKEFLQMFKWFYVVAGFFLMLDIVLNVVSGFCLLRRKCRMFSLVVAGLNCVQVPVGTILGVFTIVVLMRDSVRRLYVVTR